ncbi:MAG: hypothetical protein WDO24_26715 [Pseudomonadota bacterium]
MLNLVLLPLYFVPGLNLVLFYGANGYLIARGYFEQVAVRRLALPETRACSRAIGCDFGSPEH